MRYPSSMSGLRARRALPNLAAVLVAFVLGHELAFLASFGMAMDHGLASTGHGSLWALSVMVVAVLALSLLLLGAHRILTLSRLAARPVGASVRYRAPRPAAARPGRAMMRLWLLILVPSVLMFIASENVEHLASDMAAPGLGVLQGEAYGWAPIAFLAASLATAVVLALYRWRHDALVARIVATGGLTVSRSEQRRRVPSDQPRPDSHSAGSESARAPPRSAAPA